MSSSLVVAKLSFCFRSKTSFSTERRLICKSSENSLLVLPRDNCLKTSSSRSASVDSLEDLSDSESTSRSLSSGEKYCSPHMTSRMAKVTLSIVSECLLIIPDPPAVRHQSR